MKKIYNIILIIIFIAVLYLPTITYFFMKDYMTEENLEKRVLATKPELSMKEIESYPQLYEKYYNDNLPYRNIILNNWRESFYNIFKESTDSRVIISTDKKNNSWLFYANASGGDEFSYIDGRKEVLKKDMDAVVTRIKEETKKLKKKKIDIYYIIAPNKSTVYSDYLPETMTVKKDYFSHFYEYALENDVTNLYYMEELLKEERKNYETYYRTDTHWNEYGSFISYKKVINSIYDKEVVGDYKIKQTVSTKQRGDLNDMLGIKKTIKDVNTKVYYPNLNNREMKEENKVEIYTNPDALKNETVLLVGDSFSVNSVDPVTSVYKKVIRVYTNFVKYNPAFIEKYKPKKIFYVRVERSTPNSIIHYKFS